MKLLPYRRLVIKSPLPPEDVAQALWNSTLQNPWAPTSGGLFEGIVTFAGFRLERITQRHNTFTPQIHGSIVPDGTGSWISIRMLLHGISVVFLLVWHGAVLFFCTAIARWVFAGRIDVETVVVLAGVFLAGALLPSPFYFEAHKNKRMLLQLVRGTEVVGGARSRPRTAYR